MEYVFCLAREWSRWIRTAREASGSQRMSLEAASNWTEHSHLHDPGRDLCSVRLRYWTRQTKLHWDITLKPEWGHLPINNGRWKFWGDVSCCQRGSCNLQWSICWRAAVRLYVLLLWCLWADSEHNYALYWILLFPGSSAVVSNICLCLNYNHLSIFALFLSGWLPSVSYLLVLLPFLLALAFYIYIISFLSSLLACIFCLHQKIKHAELTKEDPVKVIRYFQEVCYWNKLSCVQDVCWCETLLTEGVLQLQLINIFRLAKDQITMCSKVVRLSDNSSENNYTFQFL